MLEYITEAVASPLSAAGRAAGKGPLAGRSLVALALGSAASSVAGWLSGASAPAESRAVVAVVVGRLLVDAGIWLIASAMLGLFDRRLAGPAEAEGVTPFAWTAPVAVVGAQRLYLLPAAAIARLFRLAYALNMARVAVWMWMAALLWLIAQGRGHEGSQATKLLLLAFALPAVLVLAGLGLAGLGWLWSPLFPGGITPFPPL